jgi:predicted RNA-binding Zn-ribbon protein involved in translation (DUF1610 family)
MPEECYIILSITTKCPKCGKIFMDEGKDAESWFGAQMTCPCGFIGELPQ